MCCQKSVVYKHIKVSQLPRIMSEISQADQASYQLPPGGEWFYTQQPMLEAYHATGSNYGLAVAWDTTKGAKMYGLYNNMAREMLMLNLLDTPVAHRNCYELLVENVLCKAYADVEWEGPEDADHSELWRLVAAIRAKVQEELSHEPKIYVSCGTRPSKDDPDILKHSYHIVLENIIYERNNDGQMKQFFTGITGFSWMDDCEEKQKVDGRVYTKNRVFRLPHCTKSGSTIPLVRISGDPLADELKDDWGRDAQAVLPFFISNPAIKEDCKFIQTPTQLLQQVTKEGKLKRPRTMADNSLQTKLFPVPLQIVRRLLVLAGDNVSTLGSVQYLPEEEQWKIQGDHRGNGRKCLATHGTTHTNNNCLLFVELFQAGFKVHYFCTASECSCHAKKIIIGYISMNLDTFEWQIALSPVTSMPDTMQIDEEAAGMQEMQVGAPVPQATEQAGLSLPQDQSLDNDMSDDEIPVVGPPTDTKNPALNSYDQVKARYEHVWFKVCNPAQFVVLRPKTGLYAMYKQDSCFKSAPDVRAVYYYEATKDTEHPFEKKRFVTAWLADEDIHLCEGVVVDPTLPEGAGFDLNIWTGFDAAKLPPVPDTDVLPLVQPMLHHILRVYANDNEEHAHYFTRWLANPFQLPHAPTGVAILLYGKEGCGKGIIPTFHRLQVLGKGCSTHVEDPEKELFSTHAGGLVNKVFVQADEVRVGHHDRSESLKNIITNETITYEPKFAARMTLKNMVNLLMTTNNENATSISPTCRRYALFRCSNVYKGNIQYFTDLGKHLARPEVARAWYQYLMTLDMGKFQASIHFQEYRPRTEYLREAQQATISCVSRFLSALINRQGQESDPSTNPIVVHNGGIEITAALLYKKYQEFHMLGNYKFIKNQTSFGREIKRMNGIEKRRTMNGYLYKLELGRIKECLTETNEYDEEAMIDA